jgi:hypothetical protein
MYYTRSRRVDGRVVREYIGSGPAAELVALMDEQERARLEAERAAWLRERHEIDAGASSVRALGRLIADALAAELEALGFRNHRGEWRRPRG